MLNYELVNKILKVNQDGEIKEEEIKQLHNFILRSESNISSIELLNCSIDVINEVRLWRISWGVGNK